MNDCEHKPTKKERLSALEDHIDDINERLSGVSASADKRATALEAHIKEQTTRLYQQTAGFDQKLSRLVNRFNEHRTEVTALLDDKIVSLVSEHNALREKLGKVEAALSLRIDTATRKGDKAVEIEALVLKTERDWFARVGEIEARIDKLEEVVSGAAADGVEAALQHSKLAHQRIDDLRELLGADRWEQSTPNVLDWLKTISNTLDVLRGMPAKVPFAPFPTGAATTVDDALRAVEPKCETCGGFGVVDGPAAPEPCPACREKEVDDGPPRRGDRVRLEGARSIGNTRIGDGWYNVLGQQAGTFQVRYVSDGGDPSEIVGLGKFWIENYHSGLKEVRRGAAQLDD